jgi:hypothetical protein
MNSKKSEDGNSREAILNKIKKHIESNWKVLGLVIAIIILVIVWAHNCPPDHFMAKYKLPFSSPDFMLSNKNLKNKVGRSDIDSNWDKPTFLATVEKFNHLASSSH